MTKLTRVSDAMSMDVTIANPDQPIRDAARAMVEIDAGVLPVGEDDQQKRIVGILSLGDIAITQGAKYAGNALCGISEPGGEHSQTDAPAAR